MQATITTVTSKNMVTIPAAIRRRLGIKPGDRLDWQPVEDEEEILVRVIPDRGTLARRLLGAGREFAPERDAVAELIQERAASTFTEAMRGLHEELWPVNPEEWLEKVRGTWE